jgi:hypothetical protein
MKRRYALLAIGLFFLGFISIIGIDSFVSHPNEIPIFQPPTPTPTPVTLLLPTNALQGKLLQAVGTVKRMPWDKMKFEPATAGALLYQGDELATIAKSSAVFSITASVSGTLDENTDIILGSLLPNKIAFIQKTGTGKYQTTDSEKPLSIKSLGALIYLEQGTLTVTIDNNIISITLLSARAKLAYINNDNITQVWELTERDTATINDSTGKVKTSGTLLSENDQ